jgi:hypothetical protein
VCGLLRTIGMFTQVYLGEQVTFLGNGSQSVIPVFFLPGSHHLRNSMREHLRNNGNILTHHQR